MPSRRSVAVIKVNSTDRSLKSDRVNLVAPASPVHFVDPCQVVLYKLRSERLTRLGNSNVLRLPVPWQPYVIVFKKFILKDGGKTQAYCSKIVSVI